MRPAEPPATEQDPTPEPQAMLDLLKWHLDRYDRLRVSTASRASVVLSAGAILSTGDAVLFARLLNGIGPDINAWMRAAFGVGLMLSAVIVVFVLIRAAGVLVTLTNSRALFSADNHLPKAFLFNGPDTLSQTSSFADFRAAVRLQTYETMLDAAAVELWLVIQQHRHRYANLRSAVRLLRWSALAFLFSLSGFVIAFVASIL